MNSLISFFLYLNGLELKGIVYTFSQYHLNGDGVHMMGEVTPHYCCIGTRESEGPVPNRDPDPRAKDLKLYRSFECGGIKDTIRNESAV